MDTPNNDIDCNPQYIKGNFLSPNQSSTNSFHKVTLLIYGNQPFIDGIVHHKPIIIHAELHHFTTESSVRRAFAAVGVAPFLGAPRRGPELAAWDQVPQWWGHRMGMLKKIKR